MNPIKIASTSLLTLVLIACGGGSGGLDSDSTDNENTTVDNTSAGVTVGEVDLGYGVGNTFVPNEIQVQDAELSAGGSTNLSVSIVDADSGNNYAISKTYVVRFSSVCADRDPAKAEFSVNEISTSSGTASTFYQARGCTGDDIITASISDEGSTTKLAVAVGKVTVEPPEVNAITFIENSEESLGIAGIPNSILPETALVSFGVFDNFGNPIEGKTVTFKLSSSSAGASLSSAEGITNEEGIATAAVNAGNTHGQLSVTATTNKNTTGTVQTSSFPVSVTTGIAAQHSFSIAAEIYNPDSYFRHNEDVIITATAVDRFGNPVPDETTINFTAESGLIPSTCQTINGTCSVSWFSNATRPGNFDSNLGSTKNDEWLPTAGTDPLTYALDGTAKGFTTITAYTIGEGGYTEENASGRFDIGESFVTHPEVFRDDDFNSQRGSGAKTEEFFELNPDGAYTAAPDKYQGVLCSVEAQNDGHCANLMYVSDSIRLVQSDGRREFTIELYDKIVGSDDNHQSGDVYQKLTEANIFTVPNDGKIYVYVSDFNGNIPPEGTALSYRGDGFLTLPTSNVMPTTSEGLIVNMPGFPYTRGAVFGVKTLLPSGIPPESGTFSVDGSYSRSNNTFNASVQLAPPP